MTEVVKRLFVEELRLARGWIDVDAFVVAAQSAHGLDDDATEDLRRCCWAAVLWYQAMRSWGLEPRFHEPAAVEPVP